MLARLFFLDFPTALAVDFPEVAVKYAESSS